MRVKNDPTKTSMTVAEVIAKRRSVRSFTEQKVPTEILNQIVEAGIHAPSGSNWQNQRFLVVDDSEEILRIGKERFVWPYKAANLASVRKTHPAGIIGHAPAMVIVFSDSTQNDRRGNGEYHIWQSLEIQNCSAAIENMLILATAMGVGSCWISASDKMNFTRMFSGGSWRKLLANYEIPEHFNMQGIVILGYPKAVDEEGFAKGESMHGATVWQSTARRELPYYLIGKRQQSKATGRIPSALDKFLIRGFSKSIKACQKGAAYFDKKIHRIEFGKYLSED